MKFESLQLRHFRNYKTLDLKFSDRINVFIGMNGQGKTNILEALYFSIQGDSFRYGDLNTLVQLPTNETKNVDKSVESSGALGETTALVQAHVVHRDLNYKLRTLIHQNKKKTEMNSKSVTKNQLQKIFKAVIFSPESLAVIKEGASLRRDLIDELLYSIYPQCAELLNEYKRVLKTRNRLLSDYGETRSVETLNVLESLHDIFIQHATDLTEMRTHALKEISQSLNTAMRNISNFQSLPVEMDYLISSQSAKHWSHAEIEENLRKRATELRDAEFHSGTSLVGPHKHDIVFLYGQNDSRFFCSQGQQRALILAFKMAQIVYHRKVHGEYPVMMLDDVLSELDEEKRQSLVQFLHEIQTQTFITTTDLSLPASFAELEISVFRIKEGSLCPTNQ